MTPARNALEQISHAALRITTAADEWNAVDLRGLGNCLGDLERAASELQDAFESLRELPANEIKILKVHVTGLRKAAARLERLTDSAACFLRCAPGLACDETGLYQAGGSICYTAPVMEARGMQV